MLDLDPDALREAIAEATPDELAIITRALESELRTWRREPHQVPPDLDDSWATWLIMAGRGSGKTAAGSLAMNDHALGRPCDRRIPGGHLMRVVGQTFTSAVALCYSGPSGLKAVNPEVELVGTKKGTVIRWPNGAEAYLFGAFRPQDVDAQRGHESCFDWHDEKASWRIVAALDVQAEMGHRLGKNPRRVITTTPKNRPEIRALVADAQRWAAWRLLASLIGYPDVLPPRQQRVRVTAATTQDNPHLEADVRDSLYATYSGTRLGDQELGGVLLDDAGTILAPHWFDLREHVPSGWRAVRVWDFAATDRDEGGDPDYTAGVRIAMSPRATYALPRPDGTTQPVHEFSIDDVARERFSPAKVEALVYETARVDGPNVRVLIEEEMGSAGKHNVAHYRRLLAGIAQVEGVKPTGPKPVRISLLATVAEQGRVSLVRAPWNRAFLDEAEAYIGDDSEHDDQLDAAAYAIAVLEGRGRQAKGTLPTAAIVNGSRPVGRLPVRR